MREDACLTQRECEERFKGKQICVFSTSNEAEDFANRFGESIEICAFLDNFRSGGNNTFKNRPIISVREYLEKYKSMPVIVATYRFAFEIIEQMELEGLTQGKDLFVWDDAGLFHSDDTMKRMETLYQKIWPSNQTQEDRRILIPFDNRISTQIIRFAYFANYLAGRENAAIYAYFRFGLREREASGALKQLYTAFHCNGIVDENLSSEQALIADHLFIQEWKRIHSWEDVKSISLFDIHFGTAFIRDFFRRFLPSFDVKDSVFEHYLKAAIRTVVFWKDYLDNHDVRAVVLSDGANWESILCNLSVSKGIPTYAVNGSMRKLKIDNAELDMYQYFDRMWENLSANDQDRGIRWAQRKLSERIKGETGEVAEIDKKNFAFANPKSKNRILRDSGLLKLLICPHSFEEDCYWYGEHLFADNYFSWLVHLGELSEQTPEYEWYFKPHPAARKRDYMIWDMILVKYKRIIRIPDKVSPLQLKEEGIEYAFTESGTIGHEYPMIGIQVINAGVNPHSKFDFCWNPTTQEEFDRLVFDLKNHPRKDNITDLFKFYSLKYYFYDWHQIPDGSFFFKSELLQMSSKMLQARGKATGAWILEKYLEEFDMAQHERIIREMPGLMEQINEFRPDIFYRRKDT